MGLGYIGLPTAIIAAKEGGIDVRGVDINQDVVDQTNKGILHIIEPGLGQLLRQVVGDKKLIASTTPGPADAFFIVVPTPFKGDHMPDISYVEAATRAVIPYLAEGNLFVIESTSPIGTTEAMAEIIFKERPELKGKIFIAYCPERVLPGNVIHELVHNDRVIGGIDEQSTDKAKGFYSRFVKGTLHPTNARTAEMCKLTENSSRDAQIAFANELSIICDRAGINVWELISLANKHPRVNILQPGCGVGGHCIAVDPYFLTAAYPEDTHVIATARQVNNYKAEWCAGKIKDAISQYNHAHPGKRPTLAMMGVAFKPDIDDLRESPAAHIIDNVISSAPDADILICEPNVSSHHKYNLTDYRQAFEKADIVAMLTAHSPFKQLPYDTTKTILDFCGIYKK